METVVRFVLLHRRVLAALLTGLAVWAALSAVTRSPDTREVHVAARDLASGSTVRAQDVTTRRLPRSALPDGLIEASLVRGRSLSGAMREGEVFTDRRVVDPRDVGAGRVLSVVEVSAASGDLVRPGDAVDLLAVGEDGRSARLAPAVDVVTVRVDPDRDAAVLGVAATPASATKIARATMTSRIAAVVVARQ